MRRVSSSNVLVVSPFEVAWVSDDSSAFSKNAGCISFEARGQLSLLYRIFSQDCFVGVIMHQ